MIIQCCWEAASPCALFRPPQHAFLQRWSYAALSAGTHIKWIQHSCPSRLRCSGGWGGGIYSVLQSPQNPSRSLFATALSDQVDISPSLTSLVLFSTSLKSREHHAKEVATCPTLLPFCSFSLYYYSGIFIYTDRRTNGPRLLTCRGHLFPRPHHTPPFCRCLIVVALSCAVLAVPPAQRGRLPPALVAFTSIWLYF